MQPVFDTNDLTQWPYDDAYKEALKTATYISQLQHGHEWNHNFRSNMARNDKKWISQEYDKHDGPVILCGAGSSLSLLPQLVHENPAAAIMVCDKSVERVLCGMGVSIDWIVSRDSQAIIGEFLTYSPCDARVVLSLFNHEQAVDEVIYTNEIYWYGPIAPWSMMCQAYISKFGSEHATTFETATVLGCMADIATRLGFDEVIVIGGDLSFPDEAAAHKDGQRPGKYKGLVTCDTFVKQAAGMELLKMIYPGMKYLDASGGLLSHYWQSYEWSVN